MSGPWQFNVKRVAPRLASVPSSGGGGGYTPPNILDWTGLGANNTERSGVLQNNINGPFLNAPTNWTYEAAGGPNGIPCCSLVYDPPGPDSGACNTPFFADTKVIYMRMLWLRTVGTDAPWKIFRVRDFETIICTPGIGFVNEFILRFDAWQGSPDSGSVPANNFWHYLEMFVDISVPSACRASLWLNDPVTPDIDITYNFSSGATPPVSSTFIDNAFFNGEINETFSVSGVEKISKMAASTERIGPPTVAGSNVWPRAA